MKSLHLSALLLLCSLSVHGQTDCSLFMKKDGAQVPSLSSADGASYRTVGHHGPAVENLQMALRLYFNDSGAIDVYNKRKDGLELARYRWYPSEEQQAAEGAGADEYYVGKTVGLGGMAVMDGDALIRPVASGERTARAGRTRKGCYAEIVSRGVTLSDGPVNLTLRIEVKDGSRWATIKASASRKLRFVTGVNYPERAGLHFREGLVAVWGVHPADVSRNPGPIGSAIVFDSRKFSAPKKEKDQILIVSRPSKKMGTKVFSASCSQVLASEGGKSQGDWLSYLEKMLSE